MLLAGIKSMKNKPTILIIFGVSGDLSKRYLLPAVGAIAKAGMMPKEFQIIGLTRQKNINTDSLLKKTSNIEYLREHLSLQQLDVTNLEDYKKLGEQLKDIEKNFITSQQILFYLSVPPKVSKSIIELLGESGLSKIKDAKLLLEKPFGVDLENAIDLTKHIEKYFEATQVYRVDHYLAKETAQNIIVFRDGDSTRIFCSF